MARGSEVVCYMSVKLPTYTTSSKMSSRNLLEPGSVFIVRVEYLYASKNLAAGEIITYLYEEDLDQERYHGRWYVFMSTTGIFNIRRNWWHEDSECFAPL